MKTVTECPKCGVVFAEVLCEECPSALFDGVLRGKGRYRLDEAKARVQSLEESLRPFLFADTVYDKIEEDQLGDYELFIDCQDIRRAREAMPPEAT